VDATTFPMISADSHVNEPRMLWWDGLPESMRDAAPARIRPTEDGSWELKKHEDTTLTQRQKDRIEEMSRVQTNDLSHRFQVMHDDGLAGECVFPTIGLYLWDLEDPELGSACCEIYNDWIFDIIESKSDRHRCAGLIPTWTIEQAVAEVRRVKNLGLGCVMLPVRGVPHEYNHRYWEPLWDAIEESRLPIVLHQGTGHDMLFYRGPGAAVANLLATQSMAPRSTGLLATSGVLENHPGLDFVFVETNAGWISWAMDTLDYYYDSFQELPGWVKPILKEKPSFYIKRQIHGTFQWDPTAIGSIGRTGSSPLMWGSDYPHAEGTYPHSKKIVQELCGELSEEQARAIVGGTAIDLFGFDRLVVNTPTPLVGEN
jgi:predicted TIM-barrel fold metal-dependent hydrolase